MVSPEADASESLLSLFEFELLFEFALLLLFELLFEFEFESLPPTKFCIKSCNLPHSTGLTGKRQPIKQSEQATIVMSFIVLILVDFRFFLLTEVILLNLIIGVEDKRDDFVLGIVFDFDYLRFVTSCCLFTC